MARALAYAYPDSSHHFLRNSLRMLAPALDFKRGPFSPQPSPALYYNAVPTHTKPAVLDLSNRKLESRGFAVAADATPAGPGGKNKGRVAVKVSKLKSMVMDWLWFKSSANPSGSWGGAYPSRKKFDDLDV